MKGKNMTIKALIFDMDGVIMDSMGMWKTLAEDYLRSQGIEPGPIFDSDLQTMNLSQGAVFMKKKFGIDKTEEEIIADITANIKDFYLNEGSPKSGAAEMLAELKQAGMRICMATATERPLAEAALARNGLLDYFEFIITNTDVGKGKDDPAIFEKALEKINNTEEKILKAETMIVEDSHIAIRTAVTSGFKACGVYDKHEDILFPEIKETADVTVMSLDELPGILLI
jgi:HAD superfamily hydrolase (TIGR01509 family)